MLVTNTHFCLLSNSVSVIEYNKLLWMKPIWYLDTASKHKVPGSSEVLLSASQVLAQVLQLKFAFIIDLGFELSILQDWCPWREILMFQSLHTDIEDPMTFYTKGRALTPVSLPNANFVNYSLLSSVLLVLIRYGIILFLYHTVTCYSHLTIYCIKGC